MLVWRLCRQRYASLDGRGAAKVGGRWNPVGTPLVYMSASDALAVLEVRVHLPRYIPETYIFVTAEVPEHLIHRLEEHVDLPEDWRQDMNWTQAAGLRFVTEQWSAALSVPSRVVPSGRNILMNPHHPDFGKIEAGPPRPFAWDERLWSDVRQLDL